MIPKKIHYCWFGKGKKSRLALKCIESWQLFDVYEGKQIPEGKKSVAYSAIYRSADRSLTGDEVQKVFDKVVKNLENQIGAQLR